MASIDSIDLTIISCNNLHSLGFFQKLAVYATVSISGGSQHRTPTDRESGGNPEWIHPIRLEFDEFRTDGLILNFELRHERSVLGDRLIGEVRVPIKDIVEEYGGGVRFFSYEIRAPDGKPNGVLYFSSKVNLKYSDDRVEYPKIELQTDGSLFGCCSMQNEGVYPPQSSTFWPSLAPAPPHETSRRVLPWEHELSFHHLRGLPPLYDENDTL